jgi:hypothetical protein
MPDRCPVGQTCIAAANGFECLPIGTPPIVDAAHDSTPVVRQCPADPNLTLCLSFEGPITASLANEGTAALAADVVYVTSTSAGASGAALLGATSTMAFPANTVVVNIKKLEARVRLDEAIPTTGTMRVGVLDADASSPGMSMFLFAGTGGVNQLRCNNGMGNMLVDVPNIMGVWATFTCECDGGRTVARRDGVVIAEQVGCAPSNAPAGIQIGQNSRAAASLPPDEPFVGAIDYIRLYQ